MSLLDGKKARCADCLFSHHENNALDCRRHPPTAMLAQVQSALRQVELRPASLFPPVNAESWCGEFAPKPDRAN